MVRLPEERDVHLVCCKLSKTKESVAPRKIIFDGTQRVDVTNFSYCRVVRDSTRRRGHVGRSPAARPASRSTSAHASRTQRLARASGYGVGSVGDDRSICADFYESGVLHIDGYGVDLNWGPGSERGRYAWLRRSYRQHRHTDAPGAD